MKRAAMLTRIAPARQIFSQIRYRPYQHTDTAATAELDIQHLAAFAIIQPPGLSIA
ncbi:hypothetical protein XVE_5037 [Xanthomonas vesicatoria ATCC 35937]|uniref:Uncharacterized protein n=1 Tax=Xanthomonas vesicatoria ATCC 35937 TaxID=925775 RepID=F0BL65_9XANT|nr:hypothetical protein XVE_5037 [Xanthomonas vesicatoria ATCC 35937]